MAGRKKGSGNARPEDIEQALSEWVRLGTAEKAAAAVKRPVGTLHGWRHKHPEVWKELEASHARVVRERHKASVDQAWDDAADHAQKASQILRSGAFDDDPRQFRALFQVVAEFAARGDTIARLDADKPTAITETRSRTELLDEVAEHAARLRAMGLDPSAPNVTHTGGERH